MLIAHAFKWGSIISKSFWVYLVYLIENWFLIQKQLVVTELNGWKFLPRGSKEHVCVLCAWDTFPLVNYTNLMLVWCTSRSLCLSEISASRAKLKVIEVEIYVKNSAPPYIILSNHSWYPSRQTWQQWRYYR